MTGKQKLIAAEILKEIRARLGFLLEVGLEYLSMNREQELFPVERVRE